MHTGLLLTLLFTSVTNYFKHIYMCMLKTFYISNSLTQLPIKLGISNTGYSVNMCSLNIGYDRTHDIMANSDCKPTKC